MASVSSEALGVLKIPRVADPFGPPTSGVQYGAVEVMAMSIIVAITYYNPQFNDV